MRSAAARCSTKVSFSGHETFVFRYAWLKKAVDAVGENPAVFTTDEAMVRLGIGKNMVRSVRHWGLSTGVLVEKAQTRGAQLAVSRLGEFLFGPGGRDAYLEDANSLWLLHWNLVFREQRSTTWCWTFNLLPSGEFTRDSLAAFLQAEANRRGLNIGSEGSLRRDIDCFLRTFIPARSAKNAVPEDSLDCPLVELGILEEERSSGLVRFNRGEKASLADEVFTYCLLEFWNRVAPDRESLAFSDVAYGFGGPGLAFKLDDNSLVDRLDRLEHVTQGRLVYGETAGLKQVYRRANIESFDLLEAHYRYSFVSS